MRWALSVSFLRARNMNLLDELEPQLTSPILCMWIVICRIIIGEVNNSGEQRLLYPNSRILNGRSCLGGGVLSFDLGLFVCLCFYNSLVLKSLQNNLSKIERNSKLTPHLFWPIDHKIWITYTVEILSNFFFWSSAFGHPVSLAFCSTDLRSPPD